MALYDTLNKLAKWRSVFAGWQLGSRSDTDQECRAVKDHRETTIFLRVESSALVGLLIEKGIFTEEEWSAALEREAKLLDADYERRFKGMRSTPEGIAIDIAEVQKHGTMEGWPS